MTSHANQQGGDMGTLLRKLGMPLLMVAMAGLVACGSTAATTTTTATTDAIDDTGDTVPGDVVLTSPTATTATSASIAANTARSLGKQQQPPPGDQPGEPPPEAENPLGQPGHFEPRGDKPGDAQGESFDAKRDSVQSLIGAAGDCSFTMSFPEVDDVSCYGPTIPYANHPGGNSGPEPSLPQGDTGFWNADEDGEACAAAKMNELVNKIGARVDNFVNMFAAMACAGKKANRDLPAIADAPLDLSAILTEHVLVTGLTFTTATMDRLPDDADGNPVFVSELEMSITAGDSTFTGHIILKHVPTSDDNSTYKGKLSMSMTNSSGSFNMNCAQAPVGVDTADLPEGGVLAAVVKYEKTANGLVEEANYAEFCGSDADPFDALNNIDPANKVTATNLTGWGGNYNYALLSLDPDTGLGTMAYAWQAGRADQRTRVLNVTTAAGDSGDEGTAYYGYGPDVESVSLGAIDGFVCNWAGPGGAISQDPRDADTIRETVGWDLAQKQVLSRAADATVFSASESFITYAPINNCGNLAAASTFTYENDTGTAMDNDRAAAGTAVTNNLVDLDDITDNFTMPTAPADVGGSS